MERLPWERDPSSIVERLRALGMQLPARALAETDEEARRRGRRRDRRAPLAWQGIRPTGTACGKDCGWLRRFPVRDREGLRAERKRQRNARRRQQAAARARR